MEFEEKGIQHEAKIVNYFIIFLLCWTPKSCNCLCQHRYKGEWNWRCDSQWDEDSLTHPRRKYRLSKQSGLLSCRKVCNRNEKNQVRNKINCLSCPPTESSSFNTNLISGPFEPILYGGRISSSRRRLTDTVLLDHSRTGCFQFIVLSRRPSTSNDPHTIQFRIGTHVPPYRCRWQ